MAERRMISKVISISEKVNSLSLFGRLLYTWMIPHADDFGRLPGSPAKVRALVVPMADETVKDVEEALAAMHEKGLIIWYEVNGEKFIQITNFEKHQQGLHKRTPSKFPAPPIDGFASEGTEIGGQYLSASEFDVEEMICRSLERNEFIQDDRIIRVDRQVRVQNSYIDILAAGDRYKYIFEIKRQRLSNASLDQIVKYRRLLDDAAKCILVGYGLSANFDPKRAADEKVNVVVYDDQLRTEQITLIDVKCRQITLRSETEVEIEENRNGTEKSTTTTRAREEFTDDDYPRSVDEAFRRVFNLNIIPPIYTAFLAKIIPEFGEKYAIELILEAGESARGQPNLRYMQQIHEGWVRNGIRSRVEAKRLRDEQKTAPPVDRRRNQFELLNQLEKEFEAYDTG